MKFPAFSESKLFKLKPDIVDIPATENKPVYDLIIGVETMANGNSYGFPTNVDNYRSQYSNNEIDQ